jgi:site-specific DNA recombinase
MKIELWRVWQKYLFELILKRKDMYQENKQQNSSRAVIYVRVSTTEQAEEGNSLSTQEKTCREYAQRSEFEVAEVFVERGESAKTANRTELQRMLAYCAQKKNQINAVIVYKIDRLSRNTDDYSQLRILLKRYGVAIKSTSENIENTPVGRFMENTMANIAQFDNDVRAERCSNGMREAVREGRYVWGAPVGYSNGAQLNGRPTIAPNEMAPLVLKSFELIATGLYSTEDVWRMMVKEGLKVKGGKPVSSQYFREMLRNRLYTCVIEKFGEVHKGLFEEVVSEALFEQVQRVLKNKGRKTVQYKTDNPDFPLRRFVFSPEGLKLTGSWSSGRSSKYPFYRFGGKGGNYARDEFERQFAFKMDSYAFEKEHVQKLLLLIRREFDEATKETRKEAKELQTRLDKLAEQETALVKKNIQGVLSDAVLQKQLSLVEKETIDIHAALALLRNVDVSPEEAVEFGEEYLRTPSKVWKESRIGTQTQLQWFQFPSGMTFDGQEFGTAQIACVFKVKDLILSPMSASVDPTGIEPVTSSLQMRRSTK